MAISLFRITVVQHWVYDSWVGSDGLPCDEGAPGARFVKARKVPAGTPGSTKVTKKSSKWYGRVPGSGQSVALSANKVAAHQLFAAKIRKAEMRKAGILAPYEDNRKRPLTEHLADWDRALKDRRSTDGYVDMKLGRVRKIIDACKFTFIDDLSAARVEAALAEMREQPRFGTQTSNHYLAAIKQFARWLVKVRRTAENPLAHLEGGNVRLDRRHERRELSEDELVHLLDSTRRAGPVRKMSGPDREML